MNLGDIIKIEDIADGDILIYRIYYGEIFHNEIFYQVGGINLNTGICYVYNNIVKQWVKDLIIIRKYNISII